MKFDQLRPACGNAFRWGSLEEFHNNYLSSFCIEKPYPKLLLLENKGFQRPRVQHAFGTITCEHHAVPFQLQILKYNHHKRKSLPSGRWSLHTETASETASTIAAGTWHMFWICSCLFAICSQPKESARLRMASKVQERHTQLSASQCMLEALSCRI